MDTLQFLHKVVTYAQPGWMAIASSKPDGSEWKQYFKAWPDDDQSAVDLIENLKIQGLNVFYSAHLFSERSTEKKYVIDTRTMFVDMDEALVSNLPFRPTLDLNSSNHRHQIYWILNQWLPADIFEALSHRVSYGIDKADHTGWPLGKMMRVPNTLNWKYNPPERVRVASYSNEQRDAVDFEIFPPLDATTPLAVLVDDAWIEEALKVPAGYSNALLFFEANKHRIKEGLHVHYYMEAPDRSTALWSLMVECFRQGFKREEVFLIAFHSKNNKFRYLRYGSVQALAKDVIRAEREAMSGPNGIRDSFTTSRRAAKSVQERRVIAAKLALNQMRNHGRFVHCRGGALFYILDTTGRPINITHNDTALNVLLDEMFGLNASDGEHGYVVNALINHTAGLPVTGEKATLSYYFPARKEDVEAEVLIHTGSKEIIRVTPTVIDTVVNGYRDVVFMWNEWPVKAEVDREYDPEDTWYDALFGISLNHLASEGIDAQQAMALLRSWFLMILIRNEVSSRPILAVFGQKGSGKSVMFGKIYKLMYGPKKALSSLGTPDNFDHSMATDPLYAIDNLDVWERWLPDRIARAAGISEITKRKLYTDLETVTIRMQAILGITAHAPKFGREDVVDRMLMIMLERVPDSVRVDETPMMQAITDKRAKYWGQIARDMQRVLQQPQPTRAAPFRVMDFSKIGQWIADALGYSDAFYSGIQKVVDQQRGFVLDEDGMLVAVLDQYIQDSRYRNDVFQTPAKLWGVLDAISSNGGGDRTFSKQYGNSVKLGRKLWTMLDSLQQRFNVEWKFDATQKTRVWKFTALEGAGNDDGSEA